INALHKLAAPQARVLRKGLLLPIPVEEVVVNDLLLLQEGEVVAADGIILEARDLSLNESLLTGEAFPVQKFPHQQAAVYKGTLVTTGSARVRVSAVGRHTLFGKIGTSLKVITIVKTPLQKQISSFVKSMAGIGFVAFVIIVGVNYYQSGLLVHSLLHGLTLAMSIIPEEIPVAFSTFQALGAFRLLAKGIIVKQPQYVETLGSATVICADKTGTLTQNKMAVAFLYDVQSKASHPADAAQLPQQVVEYAMWACETDPFDPMELAIHEMYLQNHTQDQRSRYQQVHEYPLSGTPPIMTHIFQDQQGKAIIAVKGAPEGILRHARCSAEEVSQIETQAIAYAQEGYRVLGVGRGHWNEQHWPASQEEFQFDFLGLIAFQDPPKPSIIESIKIFQEAGIAVKMMTGDYAATAVAIARQVGLDHESAVMTGSEVLQLESRELCKKVSDVQIFARMFPEAKLKV
ncbi:MAG: cation-translocating P-type ATPase, partial [Chitinophagaceae bacterium]